MMRMLLENGVSSAQLALNRINGAKVVPPALTALNTLDVYNSVKAADAVEKLEGEVRTQEELLDKAADDSGERAYKTKKKPKEKPKDDVPNWFRGERPYVGESGKEAAKRVLEKYGEYDPEETCPGSDFNRSKKFFRSTFLAKSKNDSTIWKGKRCMMKVYLLQHSYEYEIDEDTIVDETKVIGIYSSYENAVQTKERLKNKKGYNRFPEDCFYIDAYELDKDHWTEGFITWDGGEGKWIE